MKNAFHCLIIFSFVFFLSCAKEKTAFDAWKDKYKVSDPVEGMKMQERSQANETASDDDKTLSPEAIKSKKDKEPL